MPYVFGELKNLGIRICQECGEVTLEDEMHWHKEEEGEVMDVNDITEKIYMFRLTAHDIKLQEEITLAGVISSKIAKGEYYEDPKIAELQSSLELCSTINGNLTDKLNSIRKVIDSDDDNTDPPKSRFDSATMG